MSRRGPYGYRGGPFDRLRAGSRPKRSASGGSGRAPSAGSGQALQGYVLPSERDERRLRRRRWRRLLFLLGALAIVAGLAALYWSPLLRVQEVEVIGARHLDAQAISELSALEGASMFTAPLDRAERRIAALPLVKSVKAERRWPQTVRIEIEERRPWGYWQAGEEAYVIDEEGVVLEGLSPPDSVGAPTVYAAQDELLPGDRVDADAVGLAARLAQALPQALSLGIARFEYSEETGLAIVTEANYRVVFGDSQDVDYKLAVWQALEEELGRQAMAGHVLDLRFGDRPSFR